MSQSTKKPVLSLAKPRTKKIINIVNGKIVIAGKQKEDAPKPQAKHKQQAQPKHNPQPKKKPSPQGKIHSTQEKLPNETPEQFNQRCKAQALKERTQALAQMQSLLEQNHPITFNPENPQPMAIGIHKQIREKYPHISGHRLGMLLKKWISNPAYINNMKVGADRYNLDASIAGKVEAGQERRQSDASVKKENQ